jgi:hypothetical protein
LDQFAAESSGIVVFELAREEGELKSLATRRSLLSFRSFGFGIHALTLMPVKLLLKVGRSFL